MKSELEKVPRSKRFVQIEIVFLLLPFLLLIGFIGLAAIGQTEFALLIIIFVLLSLSLIGSLLIGIIGLGIYFSDSSSHSPALIFLSIANMLAGSLFLLYLSTEPLRFKMI